MNRIMDYSSLSVMENEERDEVLKKYNLEFLKNYNFHDNEHGNLISLKYIFYEIFYKLNVNVIELKSEYYYVNEITTKYSRENIIFLCQEYFYICKCAVNQSQSNNSGICYLCHDSQLNEDGNTCLITYGKCLTHFETDENFACITPCYCGITCDCKDIQNCKCLICEYKGHCCTMFQCKKCEKEYCNTCDPNILQCDSCLFCSECKANEDECDINICDNCDKIYCEDCCEIYGCEECDKCLCVNCTRIIYCEYSEHYCCESCINNWICSLCLNIICNDCNSVLKEDSPDKHFKCIECKKEYCRDCISRFIYIEEDGSTISNTTTESDSTIIESDSNRMIENDRQEVSINDADTVIESEVEWIQEEHESVCSKCIQQCKSCELYYTKKELKNIEGICDNCTYKELLYTTKEITKQLPLELWYMIHDYIKKSNKLCIY